MSINSDTTISISNKLHKLGKPNMPTSLKSFDISGR